MKKHVFFAFATFILMLVGYKNTEAQPRVNVNINIGAQPVWGPVGFDYVDYYYLPDIETYYYVPTRQFIYLSKGNWVFAYGLPPMYRGFDLYSGYKVVVNRPRAYLYHDTYRVKYKKFKGNHSQSIIRNSSDSRYFVVKGHPKYQGNPGRGQGNKGNSGGGGKGKAKGKGRN